MYCKMFMVTEQDPGGNKLDSLWAAKQSLDGYLRGKRIPGRFAVVQVNCDIKMIPVAMENTGQEEKKEPIMDPETQTGNFDP